MAKEEEKNKNEEHRKEQQQIIKYYERIVDRANKEIDHVHRAYHLLSYILGGIIVAGITAVTHITNSIPCDKRHDLREDANKITARFESEVDLVGRQVQNRIEEEFDKENIHKLVQQTAQERIDAVADTFIGEKIDKQFDPLITNFEKQLQDANDRLTALEAQFKQEWQENQNKIKLTLEFITTVSYAENDDRNAYEKLKKWSNDKSFPLSVQASQAFQKIRSEHNAPFYRSGWTVPWKEGVEPSKFNLSKLKSEYQQITPSAFNIKVAFIEYIWKREDIPKQDRMEFLIQVMKTDASLKAVEYAGRYFCEGAGLKNNPLAVDDFIRWWDKNKDKIK